MNPRNFLPIKAYFLICFLTQFTIVSAQTSATRILDVQWDSSNPTTGVWCWAGCISSIANYYANNTTRCQVADFRRIRFNYGNIN